MNLVKVSGLHKREGTNAVLQGISFTQKKFRKMALAGESGAGKTSLLKSIGGLLQPDAGEILFRGEKLLGPYEKLIPGHPAIAYLSQHFELRNNYRVEEILAYANTLSEEEAQTIYEVCRIRSLLGRKTDQVSGGERQRIALARLLIGSPALLLLDEPFSNLDPIHKQVLKKVIDDIGDRLKITCLLASHDPLDTLPWADELLVLKSGMIVQQGSPAEVYRQPVSEYVAALFGNYNLISPARAGVLSGLPGVEIKERPLFIRPESFTIARTGIPGVVEKLVFFGSYSEAEVNLSGTKIVVRTADPSIVAGQTVTISLFPDAVWYGLNC